MGSIYSTAPSSPKVREASPPPLLGLTPSEVTDFQPNEGIGGSGEESDPSILLRDGNAVHMGKGAGVKSSGAENQRGQCTDTRGLPAAAAALK